MQEPADVPRPDTNDDLVIPSFIACLIFVLMSWMILVQNLDTAGFGTWTVPVHPRVITAKTVQPDAAPWRWLGMERHELTTESTGQAPARIITFRVAKADFEQLQIGDIIPVVVSRFTTPRIADRGSKRDYILSRPAFYSMIGAALAALLLGAKLAPSLWRHLRQFAREMAPPPPSKPPKPSTPLWREMLALLRTPPATDWRGLVAYDRETWGIISALGCGGILVIAVTLQMEVAAHGYGTNVIRHSEVITAKAIGKAGGLAGRLGGREYMITWGKQEHLRYAKETSILVARDAFHSIEPGDFVEIAFRADDRTPLGLVSKDSLSTLILNSSQLKLMLACAAIAFWGGMRWFSLNRELDRAQDFAGASRPQTD